jgi:hypothetical protein
VSEACALQEQTITSIGIALHIDCLFVSGSVWCACGNFFPSQLNPMNDFSIAARRPLFNEQVIVDDVPAGSARSTLATVLLDQWAWGEIAGPQVQRMAQATITDGSQRPDLLRLARLGSNGVCPGNCHRD